MRLWRSLVTSLTLVAAAACSEETSPTTLDRAGLEALAGLGLVVPVVDSMTFTMLDAGIEGPVASSWEEPPPPEPEPYPDTSTPYADIWNASSHANFIDDYLYIWGGHNYQANRSRVETYGTVRFGGQIVGTQTAVAEDSYPFIIDFGRVHWLNNGGRVYTDRSCGLSGYSHSEHSAWWEAVLGGPVSIFSKNALSSDSDVAYQPACPPDPITYGGGGGGNLYDGTTICYYWLEYDLITGYIYRNEFLFCTEGG